MLRSAANALSRTSQGWIPKREPNLVQLFSDRLKHLVLGVEPDCFVSGSRSSLAITERCPNANDHAPRIRKLGILPYRFLECFLGGSWVTQDERCSSKHDVCFGEVGFGEQRREPLVL